MCRGQEYREISIPKRREDVAELFSALLVIEYERAMWKRTRRRRGVAGRGKWREREKRWRISERGSRRWGRKGEDGEELSFCKREPGSLPKQQLTEKSLIVQFIGYPSVHCLLSQTSLCFYDISGPDLSPDSPSSLKNPQALCLFLKVLSKLTLGFSHLWDDEDFKVHAFSQDLCSVLWVSQPFGHLNLHVPKVLGTQYSASNGLFTPSRSFLLM